MATMFGDTLSLILEECPSKPHHVCKCDLVLHSASLTQLTEAGFNEGIQQIVLDNSHCKSLKLNA